MPHVIGSRAWSWECNHHQYFICFFVKVEEIIIGSCALFEDRIKIRKSRANQIAQNLNSIDIGHQNVNKSTWAICIFYIMSLLCFHWLGNCVKLLLIGLQWMSRWIEPALWLPNNLIIFCQRVLFHWLTLELHVTSIHLDTMCLSELQAWWPWRHLPLKGVQDKARAMGPRI